MRDCVTKYMQTMQIVEKIQQKYKEENAESAIQVAFKESDENGEVEEFDTARWFHFI